MSRAADIHREIAALHVELAELAGGSAEPANDSKPKRRVKVHPGPIDAGIQVTDLERMRASKMLRRRGLR